MRVIRLVATLSCCAILFVLLNSPVGNFPPLGRFLNPFAGFWTNNRSQDVLPTVLTVPGLIDHVEVRWDERRVPHIIARNRHDLFMAQGYLVARERLWQMDFQSRAAAGRLAEILGPQAVEHDRFRRRIGLARAAGESLRQILDDPETRLAAESFSDGVNAWIDALSGSTIPLEYKILDYMPEPWSPFKSALLLKSMAYTLTFRNAELSMTRTAEYLGKDLMDLLYPEEVRCASPAVPAETQWGFIPTPGARERRPKRKAQVPLETETDPIVASPWMANAHEAGSNAWVVSGRKTVSGYPILCGDPHLALTLPSIWYEMQLIGPDINVYGVTIPGVPGVLIGFNADLAWATTNAGSDVMDWYVLTYRDSTRQQYRYGSTWKPIRRRNETIAVLGANAVVDTVLETHYGPVVRLGDETGGPSTIPLDAALRWTAHDASNELLAFLHVNTATSPTEFADAVKHYDTPALNFVYADRTGNVGIIHAGKFPLRRKGQGRFLSDGADVRDEWAGWVPREHLPRALNPPSEFLGSANQAPTDSRYPYYLGSEYASCERADRIHDVLEKLNGITPEAMISLQNDTFSDQALALLRKLLPVVGGCAQGDQDRQLLRELETWDGEYRRELYGPTIFEEWWKELYTAIWRDDIERDSITLRWPRRDVTTALILDGSIARFADDRTTPERERWNDLVCRSFQRAASSLRHRLGPLDEAWQWGNVRRTTIPHLARIAGLGRQDLKTSGIGSVINATTGESGPSWRMVVALGPELKAWGIYPGGQSGNPGSDAYDNFVNDWVRGFTYELNFLRSASDTLQWGMQRTELRRSP